MERFQSTWEHQVRFNLSESGVHPLSVRELVGEGAALDAVLDQPLIYTQTNGTEALRTAIAALYPGAGPANVEVTNGGSEANFLAAWHLVQPGDEVVVLVPTYMQTHGLVRAFGGAVREWPLVEDRAAGRWRPDLDRLDALIGPRTRAIVLCTPNNPTGARLAAEELDAIAAIAARHGCWIVSDEIYRGAELDGVDSPSMWGRGGAGHRDQRAVQGVWAARPPRRLGRRHARGCRGAVGVSRLHHHRARRLERSAGAGRPRPRHAPPAARAHPPGDSREPAAGRGVAGESRRPFLVDRARRRRHPLHALRASRSTRPNWSRGCAKRRACWWCLATSSGWTATCGWASASAAAT